MKPVPHGEPYAGKLHVRFDEGAGVPDNKGRPALLYTLLDPACAVPTVHPIHSRAVYERSTHGLRNSGIIEDTVQKTLLKRFVSMMRNRN